MPRKRSFVVRVDGEGRVLVEDVQRGTRELISSLERLGDAIARKLATDESPRPRTGPPNEGDRTP